jgi:hypothetical protein
MSLFSWFSPGGKKKKHDPPPSVMADSGLSRLDSTKPVHAAHHNARAEAANRKHERMARREQLYAVVREAMVRAGVLSASYKFKVLSLDAHGRQFLVMVDLAREAASDTNRLAEIEAMVAQMAKARHDIVVTAVYWRANEHVAVGDPAVAAGTHRHSGPAPLESRPHRVVQSRPAPLAPQVEAASRPAPLQASEPRPAEARAASDPLHPEEVAAFRKALDVGMRGEQALAAAQASKPAAPQHNYTLLTGFEDTELADEGGPGEHLSATQYGLLK